MQKLNQIKDNKFNIEFWIEIWGFGCLETKMKQEYLATDAFLQVNTDPKFAF